MPSTTIDVQHQNSARITPQRPVVFPRGGRFRYFESPGIGHRIESFRIAALPIFGGCPIWVRTHKKKEKPPSLSCVPRISHYRHERANTRSIHVPCMASGKVLVSVPSPLSLHGPAMDRPVMRWYARTVVVHILILEAAVQQHRITRS